jgi:hypothetical protein
MDFIEQLFGISPDNGDGTTEILWLAVLAILLGAALCWKRWRAPWRRTSASLQSPRATQSTVRTQPRFACMARTRVGDQEAVIVTSDRDLSDAAGLVGSIVLIDGAAYAVHDVATKQEHVRTGDPLMMKVRKLAR